MVAPVVPVVPVAPVASIAPGTVSVAEGGVALLTISLSRLPDEAVDVRYGSVDGTAAAGSDYVSLSGSLRFTPGGPLSRVVDLVTSQDSSDETGETVTVRLLAPSVGAGYSVSQSAGQAVVTITDDDSPAPAATITARSVRVVEGDLAWFTIRLSSAPSGVVRVGYRSVAGTATASSRSWRSSVVGDFEPVSGSVLFSPGGPLSRSVRLVTNTDDEVESGETVSVRLNTPSSGAGFTVGAAGSAQVTIADAGVSAGSPAVAAAPKASVAAHASPVAEGAVVWFAVSLASAPSGVVRVGYASADGTAKAGADYTRSSGSVWFSPGGPLRQLVPLTIVDDVADELDETVFLRLSAPSSGAGYVLGSSSAAQVTITDDDASAPAATVRAYVSPVAEGATAWFTVSLSAAPSSVVNVGYRSADGTAQAGSDYTRSSGSVRFYPGGSLSRQVYLQVSDDLAADPGETVFLRLNTPSSAAGYTVGSPGLAQVTITDDDAAAPVATIAADAAVVTEGAVASFTISLSAPPSGTVNVGYGSVAGTAEAGGSRPGGDFEALSGSARFLPGGALTQTVSLTTKGDSDAEPGETVYLRLNTPSGDAGYTVGSPGVAEVTINDDDSPVSPAAAVPKATITPDFSTVAEGSVASFSIELSAAPSKVVEVSYASVAGTATAYDRQRWLGAWDFRPASGSVRFSPGGPLIRTALLPIRDDLQNESGETVALRLSAPAANAGYALGSPDSAWVTIANDDPPAPTAAVTAGSATVAEGSVASFTVELSAAPAGVVQVSYASVAGTATPYSRYSPLAAWDFKPVSGSLVFSPGGPRSRTVQLEIGDDDRRELGETFSVRLDMPAAGAGYVVGSAASATVTITDGGQPAPAATIAADAPTVAEGSVASFTVTLSQLPAGPVEVGYASVANTATAYSRYSPLAAWDFKPLSGSLVFSPGGPRSRTVLLEVRDDIHDESDETVSLRLSTPGAGAGYVLGTAGAATVTITDNDAPDPKATITAGSPTVAEGSVASFTISLSAAPAGPVEVSYASVAGTATPRYRWRSHSADYVPASGSVMFSPGGPRSRTVQLVTIDDLAAESAETVSLQLSAPAAGAGYALGSAASAQVSITDDDQPAPTASITPVATTVTEGSDAWFTIALDRAPSGVVYVRYESVAGTASVPYSSGWYSTPGDFKPVSGSVLFWPGGPRSRKVHLTTKPDRTADSGETVSLRLRTPTAGAGYLVGSAASAQVTINDPAASPAAPAVAAAPTASVAVAASAVVEGTVAWFTISLSAAPTRAVDVAWRSGGGTAVAGRDYTADSGTARFSPGGPLSRTVPLVTWGDSLDEPNKTVTLRLTGPASAAGYAVGSASSATVTINDDDPPPPTVTLTADSPTVAEGDPAWFTIALSAAPAGTVEVGYTSVAGTALADSGHRPNGDFEPASGTVQFWPGGPQSLKVPLVTQDDLADELNETVAMRLLPPAAYAGYTLGSPDAAQVTITDNDAPAPQATITPRSPTVAEDGLAWFTISLSAAPSGVVDVHYESADGTAKAGSDYVRKRGSVRFYPSGPRSHTVPLAISDDVADELDETVQLRLSTPAAGAGYLVGSPASAQVTITDDDRPPPTASVSANSPTVAEGGLAWFTVGLSSQPAGVVDVSYRSVDGTAEAGSDYSQLYGSLRFYPGGVLSQAVALTTSDDLVDELDETVFMRLRAPVAAAGYTVGSAGSAQVTIADDDRPPPAAAVAPVTGTVAEGATAWFTISLSGEPSGVVDVSYASADGAAQASSDYASTSGSVRFWPGGPRSRTVPLATSDDTADEPDETVYLRLSTPAAAAGYTVGPAGSAAVTITDNDQPATTSAGAAPSAPAVPMATITAAADTVAEGAAVSFTIELSAPPSRTVYVRYASLDGTAKASSDYSRSVQVRRGSHRAAP